MAQQALRKSKKKKLAHLPPNIFVILRNKKYSQSSQANKGGKAKMSAKKTDKAGTGHLMKLWDEYNEKQITTGDLLKKCSHMYMHLCEIHTFKADAYKCISKL